MSSCSRPNGEAMRLEIPLRLPSLANERMHWRARAKRVAQQRLALALAWGRKRFDLSASAVVTLTRVAPRDLDDDNLAYAFKAIRDEVAKRLGLADDRDPRVRWAYGQRRGLPKQCAVVVVIESGGDGFAEGIR